MIFKFLRCVNTFVLLHINKVKRTDIMTEDGQEELLIPIFSEGNHVQLPVLERENKTELDLTRFDSFKLFKFGIDLSCHC